MFTALVRRPILCVIQTDASTMQQQQHLVLAVHFACQHSRADVHFYIFGLPLHATMLSQSWRTVLNVYTPLGLWTAPWL